MHLGTKTQISPLTPRQLQILKLVRSFQISRYYSPTVAELASELGVSRSTAFGHITELRKKGLLSTQPGKVRSLKLTSKAQELLRTAPDNTTCSNSQLPGTIPLAGKVAAGSPVEAIEQSEQFSLSSIFGTQQEIFALKVVGESMVDKNIRDGDYAICRRRSSADNGQLVVAILDNENATLKKFYKQTNRVRLQPANNDYEPIYSENCRIEAVVIGLVRKF